MTTLQALDTDHCDLPEMADRLLTTAPDVSALVSAMTTFLLATEHRPARLPDQTAELDFMDLAVLLALINDTRDRLAQVLDHVTGDQEWVGHPDRLDAAWTSLQDAATPLSSLVTDLHAYA